MFNLFGKDFEKEMEKYFGQLGIGKHPFEYKTVTTKLDDESVKSIQDYIDKRVREVAGQIKQESVNKAVKKYFDELSFNDLDTGKKCDTYDIIRQFAMDSIGVTENGKLSPEFVKIVRDEIVNLIREKVDENIDKPVKVQNSSTFESKVMVKLNDVNKLLRGANLVIDFDENNELRIYRRSRETQYKNNLRENDR